MSAGTRPLDQRWRAALDVALGLVWNPIVEKEVLARMRSWRAPLMISIFIFILSLVGWAAISIVSMVAAANSSGLQPGIGLALFGALMSTELLLIVLLAPALTAGAISGEKERQTLDLLLCTRVRPSAIVSGKLVASLLFMLLMVLISVPLMSLVFLFGGIEVDQVLVTTLVVAVTALTVGAIGVFCSALIRNTIASTAVAFVLTLVFLGAPFVVPLFMTAVTSPNGFTAVRGQPFYQLGEPFFALGSTLIPPSAGFGGGNAVVATSTVGRTTVCTSTPGGGTQCQAAGTSGPSSIAPNLVQPSTLPLGNVVLQGDAVVQGPFTGWHTWQLFTLLDGGLAALLVFLSTLLLGSRSVSRAGRALRPPRDAVLPPIGRPGGYAPLPPPGPGPARGG